MEQKKVQAIIIYTVIGLVSVFFLTRLSEFLVHGVGVAEYLDQKQTTVMQITAASTAASTAISMLPGDMGTAIADKMADMSTYSMLVLCAIFLEKYLVSVTGSLAFGIIFPAVCLLLVLNELVFNKTAFKEMCFKFLCVGLLVYAVVPISVMTSKSIEESYQASINTTVETALESAQEIENNSADESLLDKFLDTVTGGASAVMRNFEGTLNQFTQALSVLIVTSCLIPLIVLAFFWWLLKMLVRGVGLDPESYRLKLTEK